MNKRLKSLLELVAAPVLLLGMFMGLFVWSPHGWAFQFLAFMVPGGLILLLVAISGFRLSNTYLAKWTKAHGVEVTDQNRDVVRRYLLRGRRIRTAGGMAGYLGYYIWAVVVDPTHAGFWWIVATFAGYLIGAAVAEIWAFRPQAGRVRAASLAPRRITDYVPTPAVVAVRAIPIALLVLIACWPLIPDRRNEYHYVFPGVVIRPSIWPVLLWAGGATLLWVFIEVTARRIVRRPQPLTEPDLIAADDAIRSTAIHGLVGAGLALMLGLASASIGRWQGYAGPDRLNNLFMILALLTGLSAPFAWLRLGVDQSWIVRRSRPQEQVAA